MICIGSVTAIPVRFSPKSIARIIPICKYTPPKGVPWDSCIKSGQEALNLSFKIFTMRAIIEAAWEDRSRLEQEETQSAIRAVIEQLDLGQLRVAEPTANGWQVNEWVKKAVVLYFPIQKMETLNAGPMEFHDKMPLKKVSSEEFIKIVKKETGLDLSKPTMTIHVGPYFEWDREKKDFKRSKLVVTRELGRKNNQNR